jgi:hypothetical protein
MNHPLTQDTAMSNASSSSVNETPSTSEVDPQDTGFLSPAEQEDYKRWRNAKINSGSKNTHT